MKGRGASFKRLNDGDPDAEPTPIAPTFDTVGRVYNIGVGGMSVEDVEQDPFLDDELPVTKREPGTLTLEPITLEVGWDPTTTDNAHFHDLLVEDCRLRRPRFYLLEYKEASKPGEVWHAYVNRVGDVALSTDGQTVRMPIQIMPTGYYHHFQEAIDTFDTDVLPEIDFSKT